MINSIVIYKNWRLTQRHNNNNEIDLKLFYTKQVIIRLKESKVAIIKDIDLLPNLNDSILIFKRLLNHALLFNIHSIWS